MYFFRNRRAAILPSTLFFAITCQAGLLSAQSPEAWPFDETEQSQKNAASQPKTPVQQKLEELYRRDNRPLPDYMQSGTPANGNARPAPRKQPATATSQTATNQNANTQAVNSQAVTNQTYQQPARPTYSPPVQQSQTSAAPQGTIRQQLSDYYGSQGKTMPVAQQSWNAAETPRQPVATVNAGQTQQSNASSEADSQPRLIDRINPFRRFWQKDDGGSAPPSSAATSANTSSQAATSLNRGTAWGQTTTVSVNPQPSTPVAPPAQPTFVPAPAKQPPRMMTVELGPSAPLSSTAPATTNLRPQPVSANPPSPVVSRPVSTATPTPMVTAMTPAEPAWSAHVAATIPSDLPHSPAPTTDESVPGKVSIHSSATPVVAKSSSDADKRSAPYTGLVLQDEQDGVTAPDPTKVTTANDSEPADRPPVAPMPAVDLEQPKKHVEPAAQPTSQPSLAQQAAPLPSAAPSQPDAIHVTQSTPAPRQHSADTTAPKAFTDHQAAGQRIQGPEETAAKLHKIGERVAQKGMKGFCPVVLREQRELVDAAPEYSLVYENKRYYFSSADAEARFEREPQKYAPVAGGIDVVVKASNDQAVEGTLDFAAWYKDRLYLFTSPESLAAFTLNPLPYAGPYLKAHENH